MSRGSTTLRIPFQISARRDALSVPSRSTIHDRSIVAIWVRSRIFYELWEETESTPGDSYSVYAGPQPILRRVYFSNETW